MANCKSLNYLPWYSANAAAQCAGAVVATVGLAVLFGWSTGTESIKRVMPGLVAMNPATGVAFMFAGTSLWLLAIKRSSSRLSQLGRCLAFLVLLIGSLKLIACVGGCDLKV